MRRAYDALGIQCPTGAPATPAPGLRPPAPRLPAPQQPPGAQQQPNQPIRIINPQQSKWLIVDSVPDIAFVIFFVMT